LYADARPRFMALRELPEAERGKARERLSGDIRARINELLTPEQKPRYAALQAEIGARQTTRGRIYLLGDDGKPRAVNVRLGISDGSSTELLISPNSPEAASLKEGALVVTGVSGGSAAKPAGSTPAAGPRPMF
jgi:HlyD family secretion protein